MGASRLLLLCCCVLLLILRRRRARSVLVMSLWRPRLMVVMLPVPVSVRLGLRLGNIRRLLLLVLVRRRRA